MFIEPAHFPQISQIRTVLRQVLFSSFSDKIGHFQYNYNNFIPPEPDDTGMMEDCVVVCLSASNLSIPFQMYTDTVTFMYAIPRGGWNDVDCASINNYFVCKAPKL